MEIDLDLEALLNQRSTATLTKQEKQVLNRRIWRRRRYLKRSRHLGEIEKNAEAGRAPRAQKSKHYNWSKIAGQQEPRVVLTDFCADNKRQAQEQRQHWIGLSRDMNIDDGRTKVTRAKLDRALGKLKKNRGSPDGITAEILQAFPEDCKDKLARDLSRRCSVLELPREWCRSHTSLAPKVIGATSLAKFRPIAGLCAMRKLLGYIWLWSLPLLTFSSVQTAFVPGSHADTGVLMINKAAELSREWRLPLMLAQLDIRKAFDHVDHRAAFKAMRLRG